MNLGTIEDTLRARIAVLADENAALRRASETDPLTGLGNRAALSRILGDGAPAALALVDVDDLHGLNALHGHPVGDACLAELGQRLLAALLPGETAVRLGGDEFAVLRSADTDPAELAGLELRVPRACRLVPGLDWDGPAVGASVGTGSCATDESYDALYVRVDESLYASKRERPAA